MNWFGHALIGIIACGIMMALLKVPTAKGYSKFAYSTVSYLVTALLAFCFLHASINLDSETIFLGLLWGTGYAMLGFFQMHILKKIDASSIFPITTIASQLLVLTIGLWFFHDHIRPLQFLGMALAFVIIGSFNHAHKHVTFKNRLLLNAVAIVLTSTTNKFIQKYGAISTHIYSFIFWQLFFAMVASAVIMYCFEGKKGIAIKMLFPKKIFLWAFVLGALNFLGTFEIVQALAAGPFSLVNALMSFYVIVTFIVAWKFFGETMTKRKILFLVLAIGAMLLIRLG